MKTEETVERNKRNTSETKKNVKPDCFKGFGLKIHISFGWAHYPLGRGGSPTGQPIGRRHITRDYGPKRIAKMCGALARNRPGAPGEGRAPVRRPRAAEG